MNRRTAVRADCKATGTGSGLRGRGVVSGTLMIIAFFIAPVFALPPDGTSQIERRLINFIQAFYGEESAIQVRFQNVSESMKARTKVKNINFSKVPDAQGDGICLVEFDARDVRERSAYVPFKVFKKKQLFVLKEGGKAGDPITRADVIEKETYLAGATAYPASRDDVIGKRLRKDAPAGTVLTPQLLEDRVLVQRGEIVSIVAENGRLVIQVSGKAMDKGRMGETIRVKNLTSGKEVYGKVTGSNVVSVEF
jgi:flagellar basal body P-ring formation protein FlgA